MNPIILIVDDDEHVRRSLARGFKKQGTSTIEASSAEEALTLFREHQKEISLVVMDLVLPHMGGEGLFYHLRRLDPELPIVVVSGKLWDEVPQELVEDGALSFLRKPFYADELRTTVKNALARIFKPE